MEEQEREDVPRPLHKCPAPRLRHVADAGAAIPDLGPLMIRKRRDLLGHSGKVCCVDWAPDSRKLLSVSDDGYLMVWDTVQGLMINVINVGSSFATTCAFSSDQRHVASGGLDSICSIYDTEMISNGSKRPDGFPSPVKVQLQGHTSYISSCAFANDQQHILTASGDMTCACWDIEKGEKLVEFTGHQSDINCLSISSSDNIFVTGSSDQAAKVWDVRSGTCVSSFLEIHHADINAIKCLSDGNSFVTGGEDEICALFDLRSSSCLQTYSWDTIFSPISSVAASSSGRVLFAATELNGVHMFDMIKGTRVNWFNSHEIRTTTVASAPDGSMLATCGWDKSIRVWTGQ